MRFEHSGTSCPIVNVVDERSMRVVKSRLIPALVLGGLLWSATATVAHAEPATLAATARDASASSTQEGNTFFLLDDSSKPSCNASWR